LLNRLSEPRELILALEQQLEALEVERIARFTPHPALAPAKAILFR
jgi:hypothetical protein